MPGDSVKLAVGLKRSFRRLTIATVVVYLVIAGIAIRTAVESRKTNSALCAFKDDLKTRVAQSEDFIDEHPQGFGGIPVSAIEVSVGNERRTIHALRILDC